MFIPRSVSLPALIIVATAWASTLVVPGLALLIDGLPAFSIPVSVRISAGLSAIAAGLFVFMVWVADRVFPAVGRRMSMWPIEMGTFAVFLFGLAAALVLTLTRGA